MVTLKRVNRIKNVKARMQESAKRRAFKINPLKGQSPEIFYFGYFYTKQLLLILLEMPMNYFLPLPYWPL